MSAFAPTWSVRAPKAAVREGPYEHLLMTRSGHSRCANQPSECRPTTVSNPSGMLSKSRHGVSLATVFIRPVASLPHRPIACRPPVRVRGSSADRRSSRTKSPGSRYRHGTAVKQKAESDSTRILFCTEGIARNEILSLNRQKYPSTAMKGTRILLVDEAHSNNVDTELVISAILCRLNGFTDFKLVLMSATLDIATLYRKARDAGIS